MAFTPITHAHVPQLAASPLVALVVEICIIFKLKNCVYVMTFLTVSTDDFIGRKRLQPPKYLHS